MNEPLIFRVASISNDTEVFNGYTYKEIEIEIETANYIGLVPIDTVLEVGKKYSSVKWALTHKGKDTKPAIMCARFDSIEEVPANTELSRHLNSKLTFKLYITDKSTIKYVGPDNRRLFNAVARMIDYNHKAYKLPIYAFGKYAKDLSEIPNESALTAVVTLRRNQAGDKYELALVNIESVFRKDE
jgi:hypothetical protein